MNKDSAILVRQAQETFEPKSPPSHSTYSLRKKSNISATHGNTESKHPYRLNLQEIANMQKHVRNSKLKMHSTIQQGSSSFGEKIKLARGGTIEKNDQTGLFLSPKV